MSSMYMCYHHDVMQPKGPSPELSKYTFIPWSLRAGVYKHLFFIYLAIRMSSSSN